MTPTSSTWPRAHRAGAPCPEYPYLAPVLRWDETRPTGAVVTCQVNVALEAELVRRGIITEPGHRAMAPRNRPTLPQDARSEAEGYGDMAPGEIVRQTGYDAGHSEEGAG